MYLSLLLFLLPLSIAWPDGAPCIPNTFDSMNPLEAVEHQGGLQLSEPPYELVVEQKCYWRSQPIAFTLQGKNESIWFKGFAIQPLEWNNGLTGKRVGRLLRLDDNGSWQYQCFRFKDAATHSHNQRKKHMKIWWRNDDDESRFVQFVATVVHSQKRFWVKSVVSAPIPPCRVQRDFGPYTPPMPSAPPPVKPFKMEADREFGNFFISENIPDIQGDHTGFQTKAPLVTIIPIPTMTIQHVSGLRTTLRPRNKFFNQQSFAFSMQQQQEQERQRQIEQQRSDQRQREMERQRADREREQRRQEAERASRERAENERRQRIQAERSRVEQEQRQRQQAQRRPQLIRNQGSFRTSPTTQSTSTTVTVRPVVATDNGVCSDIDPPTRCLPWAQYCQASTYMHQYCRKTCHFC